MPTRAAILGAAGFAACVLIWGSTWLAIKVGYEGLGALTGAALRFGLAALLLAGIAVATRRPLRLRGPERRLAVAMALLMFLGDYGLIYWAEQHLDSGLTAVLFATMPLFVGAFAHALLPAERVTLRKVLGAALGVAGLAVIFRESLRVDAALLVPMGAVVLAAALAGWVNVLMKRDGKGVDAVALFANAMGLGAALLLIAALLLGEAPALPSTSMAWASVLYLAAVGSVVAFLIYYALLKRFEAVKLSLALVLTPVVALVLGAAARQETLSAWELGGTALVLAAVWVVVTARPASPPAPAPEAATAAGAAARPR